jgi:hypothetical protein
LRRQRKAVHAAQLVAGKIADFPVGI